MGIKLKLTLLSCCWIAIHSTTTDAQIIGDQTLPQNTIVNNIGSRAIVGGGTQRGQNLFHSFQEFSIHQGQAAFFDVSNETRNILTRITGHNPSNLDGEIIVGNNAKLFFLNPNGLNFGKNLNLLVSGSLISTTANSIEFPGNIKFESSGTIQQELPATHPVQLNFIDNTGRITVESIGHRLVGGLSPAFGFDYDAGITLLPGSTLALLASEVNFDGSVIHLNGHIETAAVTDGSIALGRVQSPVMSFDYSHVNSFGDIYLKNRSLLNASGFQPSSINLRGKEIQSSEGSLAITQNFGLPGSVKFQASQRIYIDGGDALVGIAGGIFTENFSPFPGSNIEVTAPDIDIVTAGTLAARTFSTANTGTITLNGDTIEISGNSRFNPTTISAVTTNTGASTGNASSVIVNANRLLVKDGAILGSISGNAGNAGDVLITAKEQVEIDGFQREILSPALVTSVAFRQGDAGNVEVKTPKLIVSNGGRLDSSTAAFGDAGKVRIEADDIQLTNQFPKGMGLPSLITSSATLIDEDLKQIFNLFNPNGRAGDVNIIAKNVVVNNNSSITVQNDGPGNAGTLRIDSERLTLSDQGSIDAFTNGGNGGNISIRSGFLDLNQGSISSSAQGFGIGGNIEISSELLALIGGSVIQANAENNQAGQVNIAASGLLLSNDSSIVATSNLGPQFDGRVEIDQTATDLTFPDTPFIDNRPSQLSRSACQNDEGSSLAHHGQGGYFSSFEERSRYAKGLKQRLAIANQYSYEDAEGNIVPFQRWMGVQRRESDGELEFVFSSQQNTLLHALVTSNETPCS